MDDEKKKKNKKVVSHDSSKYVDLEPTIDEDVTNEERKPLTMAQRRRRAMTLRRFKSKISAARKRAAKRKASPEKLKQRARRKARNILRKRFLKNKSYADLTPAEKINIDKRLTRIPQTAIDRIATRQLPSVRQAEVKRLSSLTQQTNESLDINEMFEMLIERMSPQDSDIADREGSQPKKYFSGLDKETKEKRDAHFKRGVEKNDSDPEAYKPAPGDSDVETKPSVYTKRYHKLFTKENKVNIDRRFRFFKTKELKESKEDFWNEVSNLMEEIETLFESPEKALRNKAEETGVSYNILDQVYRRGVAAWRTGHRPGTTPEQWGLARVNSFLTGGKTQKTTDADLWAKHMKTEENTPYDREQGTDSLVKIYKRDTPGETVEESYLNVDIRRGDTVSFRRESIADNSFDGIGTFVGADEETGRMRIRDDEGRLFIVKHENVKKL
jgi:hypothetical protein